VTKATGKQPKVYRLTMENFEIELDFILDQLLTPSNHDKKNVIAVCDNKNPFLVTDTFFESVWPDSIR